MWILEKCNSLIHLLFLHSQQFAIISTFLVAVAFAEPPAPRSSYLPPQARSFSAPSSQYGAPSQSQGRSSFAAQPRTNYGAPSQQQPRTNYGAPSQQQPRTNYAAPAQQPRTNYGAPAQQQPSSNYGAPAQQQPSSNYGPPSTSYGVPQAQDFNNFDSQRANSYQQAPSSNYGVPSADSYSNNGNNGNSGSGYNGNAQGYEEPAKYEFQYDVQDEQAGLDFGHKEQREGSVATGKYYVLLPDGRKQVSTEKHFSLKTSRHGLTLKSNPHLISPLRLSTTSLTKTATAQPSPTKTLAVAHTITTLNSKVTITTLKASADTKQTLQRPNMRTHRTRPSSPLTLKRSS